MNNIERNLKAEQLASAGATWCGEPLESLSRVELIQALREGWQAYLRELEPVGCGKSLLQHMKPYMKYQEPELNDSNQL